MWCGAFLVAVLGEVVAFGFGAFYFKYNSRRVGGVATQIPTVPSGRKIHAIRLLIPCWTVTFSSKELDLVSEGTIRYSTCQIRGMTIVNPPSSRRLPNCVAKKRAACSTWKDPAEDNLLPSLALSSPHTIFVQ